MLEANQWILLNALTYKIHRMKDFDEMRLYLIQQLRYMIDFDAASFYISNPAKPRELIRPVGYNFSMENMESYINGLKKIDYSEGMMYTGKNIAYRESDILKDEIRVTTEYYKQVSDGNYAGEEQGQGVKCYNINYYTYRTFDSGIFTWIVFDVFL